MKSSNAIKVLVIDDSALMRQMLTGLLNAAPDINVVGSAPDPLIAREQIKQLNPDVLTLDVEMPRMDGLEFLSRLMGLRPMPVIMVSTLTAEGADATIRALQAGAVDFMQKPQQDLAAGMEAIAEELCEKVRQAAKAKLRPMNKTLRPQPLKNVGHGQRMIAIGSSTGGVEALTEIIPVLPSNTPPVLVVQHMPAQFVTTLAHRLDQISQAKVMVATDNLYLQQGHVYFAGHGLHLKVQKNTLGFACKLSDDAPYSGHRPSADILFQSVAHVAGAAAVGVILTGMGKDGAEGLLKMRQAGAHTIGQDSASSIVYGMPKAAFENGGVVTQLPLEDIAEAVLNAACK